MEELEPRTLFSADWIGAVVADPAVALGDESHSQPAIVALASTEQSSTGDSRLSDASSQRREIVFIDGPCPGNDYLGVEAPTLVDVSLLQKRLNDLRAGIRISVL